MTPLQQFRTLIGRVKGNRPLPIFVCLNITKRCVWNCRYCAVPSFKTTELSASALAKLFQEFGQNTAVVTIGGGEPALRKDLVKIITAIRRHTQACIKIDTSGIYHEEQLESFLAADRVQVSLDGPKSTHDYLRGRGSFSIATRAAETLRRHGKDVVLNAVITKITLGVQKWNLDYARSIGASYSCNKMIQNPFAKRQPALLVSDKEYVSFLESLDSWRESVNICLSRFAVEHYREWQDATPEARERDCVVGNNLVYVECDGRMHRCPYVLDRDRAPNLLEGPWDGFYRLPEARCRTCVPNLIAFGGLCQLDAECIAEQQRHEALLLPFRLGQKPGSIYCDTGGHR